MKEEYVEGLIEIPRINEESLPEQLKGLLGQTAGALQQLPSPIRDAVSVGLKVPLGKYFNSRLRSKSLLIWYGKGWMRYVNSCDYFNSRLRSKSLLIFFILN